MYHVVVIYYNHGRLYRVGFDEVSAAKDFKADLDKNDIQGMLLLIKGSGIVELSI